MRRVVPMLVMMPMPMLHSVLGSRQDLCRPPSLRFYCIPILTPGCFLQSALLPWIIQVSLGEVVSLAKSWKKMNPERLLAGDQGELATAMKVRLHAPASFLLAPRCPLPLLGAMENVIRGLVALGSLRSEADCESELP